jgi:choline-sulfatase
MAHCFGAAGYQTAYIGKWHLASRDPVPPEERGGYQTWLAANRLEWTSHPYDTRLFDGDGQEIRLPGYRTDALIDAAIRHIDGVAGCRSSLAGATGSAWRSAIRTRSWQTRR